MGLTASISTSTARGAAQIDDPPLPAFARTLLIEELLEANEQGVDLTGGTTVVNSVGPCAR
jgi:hypothetical protein